MGPYEFAFYRYVWRASERARRHRVEAMEQTQSPPERLRDVCQPVPADQAVVGLAFARELDAKPGIGRALASEGPVLLVDVADADVAAALQAVWPRVAFGDPGVLNRAAARVATFVLRAAPATPSEVVLEEMRDAVIAGDPVVAIVPHRAVVPAILTTAETARISLGSHTAFIWLAIRAVAGRRAAAPPLSPTECGGVAVQKLAMLVRFDRSPEESIALLRRAPSRPAVHEEGLRLDQLFGMSEVRHWAGSMLADLAAWRSGDIQWKEGDFAALIEGPSGVGKTQAAKSIAAAGGLKLFACSYSRWQAAGDAHLGHLLRAMRADFAAARAEQSLMFIDEVDSFCERGRSGSKYDSYMVSAVNALLEEVDTGRNVGCVMLAATNDSARCEPGLMRPSRFSRLLRVSLPDPEEIGPMLRVRLGTDLADEDLTAVTRYAAARTGAEIEQAVSDARRAARVAGRPLTIRDLVRAFGGGVELEPARLKRTAVHEAGHLLVSVVLYGPADVSATLAHGEGVVRRYVRRIALGTYADHFRTLTTVLAGRAAEELVFGAPSDGAAADLQTATAIASTLVGSVGLAGNRLLRVGGPSDTDAILSYPELRRAAEAEIRKAADEASKLLASRRTSLDQIAERLGSDGYIDGTVAADILRSHSIEEFELVP